LSADDDYKHEATVVFRGLVAGTIFTVVTAIMMLHRCCGDGDDESRTMPYRLSHILFKQLANILVVDSAALFAWYQTGLADRSSPVTLYTTLGSLCILVLLLLTLMVLLLRNCWRSQEGTCERGTCCAVVSLVVLTLIAIFWLFVGTSIVLELGGDDDGDYYYDGDDDDRSGSLLSILTRLSFYMGSISQLLYYLLSALSPSEGEMVC
jgi:hypothetical protein